MHHGKRVRAILAQRLPYALEALQPGPDGATLVFGAPDSAALDLLGPVAIVCGMKGEVDRLTAAGHPVSPTLPDGIFPRAVVSLPRNRGEAFGQIAQALSALAPGGHLIVDGGKSDGIESVIKTLRKSLDVEDVAAKAHGKIAWMARPEALSDEFAATLRVWDEAAAPRMRGDGTMTAPGMFSADGLDPGTALLIEHLPAEAKGPAADLGAGWGALSRALLAVAPGIDSCDLIEADFAALNAARINVTDPRARFHWADVPRFEGGPYRLIMTNPPFHAGRAADPSLGQAFLTAAHRMLHPKGRVLIVANRQLPYERTLESLFHGVDAVHTDSRYKVIDAHHPRRNRRG